MQEPDVRRIGTDPQELEAFYRDHIDAVSRFVARRVDDPHLVADLVADAFLAAIDAASSYRPDRGSPGGWLFGITRHVVADELRRQGREARAVRRVGGRRLLDPESLARIVEQIDAERDAREVTAVLDCLDPADRHLFELVAVDGLTLTDVAHILGVKPNTARVRLHRCRARVRLRLHESRARLVLLQEIPT